MSNVTFTTKENEARIEQVREAILDELARLGISRAKYKKSLFGFRVEGQLFKLNTFAVTPVRWTPTLRVKLEDVRLRVKVFTSKKDGSFDIPEIAAYIKSVYDFRVLAREEERKGEAIRDAAEEQAKALNEEFDAGRTYAIRASATEQGLHLVIDKVKATPEQVRAIFEACRACGLIREVSETEEEG